MRLDVFFAIVACGDQNENEEDRQNQRVGNGRGHLPGVRRFDAEWVWPLWAAACRSLSGRCSGSIQFLSRRTKPFDLLHDAWVPSIGSEEGFRLVMSGQPLRRRGTPGDPKM